MTGVMGSVDSDLFDKATSESFTLLMVEVEASLPQPATQGSVGSFVEQSMAEQLEESGNLREDQLADLSLMDIPILDFTSGFEEAFVEAETDQRKEKGTDQVMGKKETKKGGAVLLQGASSRKRNVQVFTTPRKRNIARIETSIRDGPHPKDKGTEKEGP